LATEVSKRLFEQNLAAFQKFNPDVFKVLSDHQPSSRLAFDNNGQPDIIVDGKHLYDGKVCEQAAKQLDSFENYPTHIGLGAMKPGQLDRYGNPLLKRVLDRASRDGITFTEGVPTGCKFFLLVFGVGLGFHIDALIEKTNPVFVQFVEPNVNNLYHSLSVYPWHQLLERQACKNGAVIITFDSIPEKITTHIKRMFRDACPPGADGTPCFTYSDLKTATPAIDDFMKSADMVFDGLGFFFDETLMMKNTYMNLRSSPSNLFVPAQSPEIETPVFIVGAGPSLDKDLDFIRANADKVIIVSTGTALRSLLVNGITPDFHVEIENICVYSSIKQLADEYDLSKISLMVSTSVDPHIIKFFDNVVYYFRTHICPYPLFSKSRNNELKVSGPLIVNVSFSLALDIGAKDIYMFGTDFGARDDGAHHAKDNVLYTEGAVVGAVTRDFDIPLPGNFGGTFYASYDFLTGLKVIHETILYYGHDRRIFNCSDGARIEGAKPFRAEKVLLESNVEAKKADIQSINLRNTVMSQEWFNESWDEGRLRMSINTFADKALEIFGDSRSYMDNLHLSSYSVLARREPKNNHWPPVSESCDVDGAIACLFRCTFDSILIALQHYLGRVDQTAKQALCNIVAEEFSKTIEQMRPDALEIIDNPTRIFPAKVNPKWTEEDFIIENAATWMQTPRNAMCCCLSGLRYKYCHGKSKT